MIIDSRLILKQSQGSSDPVALQQRSSSVKKRRRCSSSGCNEVYSEPTDQQQFVVNCTLQSHRLSADNVDNENLSEASNPDQTITLKPIPRPRVSV